MVRIDLLLAKLVKTWPSLPFMALGAVFASMCVAGSGMAWRLDAHMSGEILTLLITASSFASGATMLAAALLAPRSALLLERPSTSLWSGIAAAVGSAAVALGALHCGEIGHADLAATLLFLGGSVLFGSGLGAIALRCGQLFGSLAPRLAIVYVAYSQLVVVASYFVLVGSPAWAPFDGGPSFEGVSALVLLPLLGGSLAYSSRFSNPSAASDGGSLRSVIPKSFWKLVVVVFVLSGILASFYASVVAASSLANTLNGSSLVMILRMLLAVVLACVAVLSEGRRFNLGKAYSVVMVASVALAVCLPLINGPRAVLSQVVSLSGMVFELFLWCLLAFIVFQRKVSATAVFGYGFGAYYLGSGFGCFFGSQVLTILFSTAGDVFTYMIMVLVVLACTFIVFSEREFDRLFTPQEQGSLTLDELLMRQPMPDGGAESDGKPLRKRRFGAVIEALAEEHQLSPRETDVLRCLAMGYNSSTTANKLCISWNTVRTHTRNVYGKLSVHSQQELIALVEERTARE